MPHGLALAAVLVDEQPHLTGTAKVDFETPEWAALQDWCRFHHLEPTRIPAGSRITRVPRRCLIAYTEFLLEDDHPDGQVLLHADGIPQTVDRTEQGEAPPLPFPDCIAFTWTPRRTA